MSSTARLLRRNQHTPANGLATVLTSDADAESFQIQAKDTTMCASGCWLTLNPGGGTQELLQLTSISQGARLTNVTRYKHYSGEIVQFAKPISTQTQEASKMSRNSTLPQNLEAVNGVNLAAADGGEIDLEKGNLGLGNVREKVEKGAETVHEYFAPEATAVHMMNIALKCWHFAKYSAQMLVKPLLENLKPSAEASQFNPIYQEWEKKTEARTKEFFQLVQFGYPNPASFVFAAPLVQSLLIPFLVGYWPVLFNAKLPMLAMQIASRKTEELCKTYKERIANANKQKCLPPIIPLPDADAFPTGPMAATKAGENAQANSGTAARSQSAQAYFAEKQKVLQMNEATAAALEQQALAATR